MNIFKRVLRSCLPFFLIISIAPGQEKEALATDNPMLSPLDSLVQYYVTSITGNKINMGLSFGIYWNNQEYYYNYGTIEKGEQLLPDRHTVYEIGSLTKTFTASLLARAVLDKKIDLHADIRQYLGNGYDNLEYQGIPIQVIHLANHTSGLPEEILPAGFFMLDNPDMFDLMDFFVNEREDWFALTLQKAQLSFEPGTSMQYSNAGYNTLGIILENVYGKPYEHLLKKHITRPLGMKGTRPAADHLDTLSYTKGYDKRGNITPHIVFQLAYAGGGLRSTTKDMVKYIKGNIVDKDPAFELTKVPSFEQNDEMIGLGWNIKQNDHEDICYYKDGGEPGFSSYLLIIPQQNFGIICLANQRGRQADFEWFTDMLSTRLAATPQYK